jgi:hypothetical protein
MSLDFAAAAVLIDTALLGGVALHAATRSGAPQDDRLGLREGFDRSEELAHEGEGAFLWDLPLALGEAIPH